MATRLQAVGEEAAEPAIAVPSRAQGALVDLLTLTLRTLSQKTLVALTALADIGMIASAFVLWLRVIENPTVLQLIGLAVYGLFILTAIWARKARHG